MTAIETLLAGLFDYAGLYPPASLSLRSAANNYLEYRRSKHAGALGRFIVNLDRLDEFRSVAADSSHHFALSVIAAENTDWAALAHGINSGLRIDVWKSNAVNHPQSKRIAQQLPRNMMAYFEVPIRPEQPRRSRNNPGERRASETQDGRCGS